MHTAQFYTGTVSTQTMSPGFQEEELSPLWGRIFFKNIRYPVFVVYMYVSVFVFLPFSDFSLVLNCISV